MNIIDRAHIAHRKFIDGYARLVKNRKAKDETHYASTKSYRELEGPEFRPRTVRPAIRKVGDRRKKKKLYTIHGRNTLRNGRLSYINVWSTLCVCMRVIRGGMAVKILWEDGVYFCDPRCHLRRRISSGLRRHESVADGVRVSFIQNIIHTHGLGVVSAERNNENGKKNKYVFRRRSYFFNHSWMVHNVAPETGG